MRIHEQYSADYNKHWQHNFSIVVHYRWLQGDILVINVYRGEHMSQYSWE